MKKAMVSTLCSALVIPGLGQIINQDLKKGVILLGAVFLLFITSIIKLVRLIRTVFGSGNVNPSDPETIMARLRAEDFSILWLMAAGFAAIWLYSVLDAYFKGRKIDRSDAGDLL